MLPVDDGELTSNIINNSSHFELLHRSLTINFHFHQSAEFSASITEDFGCSLNDDVSFFLKHGLMGSYYARASEWKVNINRLKTDAPSATWCRAPGITETVAIQENFMEHIAHEVNLDPAQVRLNNLDGSKPLHRVLEEFLKDVGNVRIERYKLFCTFQINMSANIEHFQITMSAKRILTNLINETDGANEASPYPIWFIRCFISVIFQPTWPFIMVTERLLCHMAVVKWAKESTRKLLKLLRTPWECLWILSPLHHLTQSFPPTDRYQVVQ